MTKFFLARQYHFQGALPEENYISFEAVFATVLRSPGALDWWSRIKDQNPKFVQEVIDEIIRRHHDVKPYTEYLKFEHKNR